MNAIDTTLPVYIEFMGHAFCLCALLVEARVLGFLSTLCFDDSVLQDWSLFCEIALDVRTLSTGHVSDRILLGMKHVHLLFAESNLLCQLQNVILNLVKYRWETEGLVLPQRSGTVRLHHLESCVANDAASRVPYTFRYYFLSKLTDGGLMRPVCLCLEIGHKIPVVHF